MGMKKRSRAIDRQLEAESTESSYEHRVLLLGSESSGKDEILREMRILHQNEYTRRRMEAHRITINKNLIDWAKAPVEALEQLNMNPDTEQTRQHCPFLRNSKFYADPQKPLGNGESISALWKDPYVLHARTEPTGVHETRIVMDHFVQYRVFDIVDLNSVKRKWAHYFEDITWIIFAVDLACYDQPLLEHSSQSEMMEVLTYFDSIVNSRFNGTYIHLFLNNYDKLEEKLGRIPLSNYFPDYSGGNDVRKAAEYILSRFNQVNHAHRYVIPFFTRPTDAKIRFAVAAVRDAMRCVIPRPMGFVNPTGLR
ncbi:P-loop containing nucleoside triphosphate hydrolase protein [Mytilinidion resinicola]|uniref:P-loop containing nucleoside triphosphate hydrolase protein n=1 Tax=Mytilinidion resinicola TaxID=574789 RepID=A0A6A6Y643_9PEZI|nr:P-loop containing nucleoside triphosphate hydrolase protein [Mytilinidion resinicola]KAF2804079.1 P-loop containing nucleoside triphosphate hydrolase protein [Mytilinidion resinicola]